MNISGLDNENLHQKIQIIVPNFKEKINPLDYMWQGYYLFFQLKIPHYNHVIKYKEFDVLQNNTHVLSKGYKSIYDYQMIKWCSSIIKKFKR